MRILGVGGGKSCHVLINKATEKGRHRSEGRLYFNIFRHCFVKVGKGKAVDHPVRCTELVLARYQGQKLQGRCWVKQAQSCNSLFR